MANGPHNYMRITEELLKYSHSHKAWGLAPADLIAIKDAASAAQRAHVDATDAVSDAEVNIPGAQAHWEADARAAVRAGKDLPSRDPIDRARISLELAQEDERKARYAAASAVGALASALNDPDTRDAWINAIDPRIDELNGVLDQHARDLAPIVHEAIDDVALVNFLAGWTHVAGLGLPVHANPVGDLRTIIGLRQNLPNRTGNITA